MCRSGQAITLGRGWPSFCTKVPSGDLPSRSARTSTQYSTPSLTLSALRQASPTCAPCVAILGQHLLLPRLWHPISAVPMACVIPCGLLPTLMAVAQFALHCSTPACDSWRTCRIQDGLSVATYFRLAAYSRCRRGASTSSIWRISLPEEPHSVRVALIPLPSVAQSRATAGALGTYGCQTILLSPRESRRITLDWCGGGGVRRGERWSISPSQGSADYICASFLCSYKKRKNVANHWVCERNEESTKLMIPCTLHIYEENVYFCSCSLMTLMLILPILRRLISDAFSRFFVAERREHFIAFWPPRRFCYKVFAVFVFAPFLSFLGYIGHTRYIDSGKNRIRADNLCF